MNGTLAVKIANCRVLGDDDAIMHLRVSLKFTIGSEVKHSKRFHPSQPVEQTLHFELTDVTGDEEVLIQAYREGAKADKARAHWKVPLSKFRTTGVINLAKADGYAIELDTKWTVEDTTPKPAGTTQTLADEGAVHAFDRLKEAFKTHSQRVLAALDTHRPWSVTHQGDSTVVVEGRAKPFRFKISETKGLLHIWLEDRESKAQWQTKQLEFDDFVTNDNVLAQATMPEYAKQFAAILTSDDKLAKAISGVTSWRPTKLELRLALSSMSFSVKLVYQFKLVPIALEKAEVLSAQVKDLKEEVKNLQTKLEAVTKQTALIASNATDC